MRSAIGGCRKFEPVPMQRGIFVQAIADVETNVFAAPHLQRRTKVKSINADCGGQPVAAKGFLTAS